MMKKMRKTSRKIKAREVTEEMISSEDEATNDNNQVDENKFLNPLIVSNDEDEDDGNDSDRELEIALRDGLLKSTALNYVVEKKRPVINKVPELKEKLSSMKAKLAWIETLDISTPSNITPEKFADDFEREVLFYKQAEMAVAIAVPRLLKMNVKVFRPDDYYAEMAKSDQHMQKVRKRLLEVQAGKERQEVIKKMREEKKFASKVQKEVLEGRQKEKKQFLENVKKHRKGMKQQLDDMLNNAKKLHLDEDDDSLQSAFKGTGKGNKQMSRNARNQKFGFGGQKKRMKHNDKKSFDDVGRKRKSTMSGRKGPLGRERR